MRAPGGAGIPVCALGGAPLIDPPRTDEDGPRTVVAMSLASDEVSGVLPLPGPLGSYHAAAQPAL
eukprot:13108887-Alexandrium_andersonii.AAC.1